MFNVSIKENLLEFYYSTMSGDCSWIDERLVKFGYVRLQKAFVFRRSDQIDPPDNLDYRDTRIFRLGILEGEYYRIEARILDLQRDLMLHRELPLSEKTFIAAGGISIFKKIDKLIHEGIVIGGDLENAVHLDDFKLLLNNFPTHTELNHYAGARISGVLRDYFDTMTDAQGMLERYLERKKPVPQSSSVAILKKYEIEKWGFIRNEVKFMLAATTTYTEKQWQTKMLEFILLLFPKYIAVLEHVQIKDYYSSAAKITNRYIDLTLVDADGHIDVVEIKKPFAKALLSCGKYRDNYTPRKELSGTIMQVEKYLFHLNKWGVAGENDLNQKRSAEIPSGLTMRIVNPKALIILGRDDSFSEQEKFDFEIIRRKYANVIDILTYDDLLRRLNNIIAQLQEK